MDIMPPSDEVTCPECGLVVGRYFRHENKICLVTETLIIEDGWCWCRLCLTRFYWHSSEKKLDQLIDNVLTNRKHSTIIDPTA